MKIKRMWLRFLCWAVRRNGLEVMTESNVATSEHALADLTRFCGRSGYLRDGRYPGGRPAERKILGHIARAQTALSDARFTA